MCAFFPSLCIARKSLHHNYTQYSAWCLAKWMAWAIDCSALEMGVATSRAPTIHAWASSFLQVCIARKSSHHNYAHYSAWSLSCRASSQMMYAQHKLLMPYIEKHYYPPPDQFSSWAILRYCPRFSAFWISSSVQAMKAFCVYLQFTSTYVISEKIWIW